MGADLVITSRSMKALTELKGLLHENTRVTAITADLAAAGQALVLAQKTLEAVGRIDVLFNNAGIGYFALMEEAGRPGGKVAKGR